MIFMISLSGVGVFATVDLQVNEILCEYRGSLCDSPGDESKTLIINDCADVLEAEQ
jgi:hypothetical protein